MLSFFRRIINSKVGLAVTFVVLGLIAFAFASGDVTALRTEGLAAMGGGDEVARVGKERITGAELRQRVTQQMEQFRQQQPTLTMRQFIAEGGFEGTVERLVNNLALDQFGRRNGMLVSKRAVDGQIASIPALQGPTGQFDPALFRRLLAEQKLTEAAVRTDFERDLMGRMLTERLLRPGPTPRELALPFANLSLERRAGEIAFVPSSAMPAGPPPTDTELQAFYGRNLARYTVPERRVVRFARVTPEVVKAQATPTEAEIAQSYRQDSAKYAASEQRSITQVVVLDQAGAQALATRARGGQPLADAARGAGLEASTEANLDKAALGQRTSPALADAVFAAREGAVVGPVRGGLGYVVARVDGVKQVAGRTLAQAREEIAAALARQKTVDALNAAHDAIDDKLADGSTFDELVGDQKLRAETTPALLATGADPDKPGTPPDEALVPLLQAAFQMQDGDEPQMAATGADGSFALLALGRIVPAAPRPLAQIREVVAKDFAADRARQAARRVAGQVLAAVGKGQSFAQAWAATGLRGEGPKPLAAGRDDVGKAQGPTRAPLALLFAMARGTAKLLEAPGGAGWAVIRLNQVIPGDASQDAGRIAGFRSAFAQVLGREQLDQFARAARAAIGVSINQAALAKVKADLLGQAGQ